MLLAGGMPPPATVANPVTIDLLALYTPAARDGAGGDAQMIARIEADVADANQVYINSEVGIRLRLVRAKLVNYVENNSLSTDLERLQNPRDGYLDFVPSMRTAVGADVVTLYAQPPNPVVGGIAYINDQPLLPSAAEWYYSVVVPQPVGPRYALVHEIGHNLGAGHDRTTDPSGGAFSYSYGYRFQVGSITYRTIMAYAPGVQIPYFSNPNITYEGVPIGVPEGSPDAADNARTLNEVAPLVANARPPDSTPPTAALVADNVILPGASTFSFSVMYHDAVAVKASTLDSSDITVTGPNGFSQPAVLMSLDGTLDDEQRVATYAITPPGGTWDATDNGTYSVRLNAGEVTDTVGNAAPAGVIGTFQVAIPFPEISVFSGTDADAVELSSGQTQPVALPAAVQYRPATPAVFTVRNAGTAPLAGLSLSLPAGFSIVDPLAESIAPGDSDVFTITVDTSRVASFAGTLSIHSNDADENPFAFFISAAVVPAPPDIAPTTPSGWAAPLIVTTSADSRTDADLIYDDENVYVCWAAGRTPLSGDVDQMFHVELLLDGARAGLWTFSPQDINAADNIEVTAFELGTLPAGTHLLALTLDSTGVLNESDESNNVITRTVNIAPRPAPDISITDVATSTDLTAGQPVTVEFGNVPLNSSAVRWFRLANDGTAPLRITRLTISGAFSLAVPPAVVELQPAQDTLFAVRPQTSATGSIFGTISIASTDPDEPSADVALHASVFAPDTAPPRAVLHARGITTRSRQTYLFAVEYSDDTAVSAKSINSADVIVTGPRGLRPTVKWVRNNRAGDSPALTAWYGVAPPGGLWDAADNGIYVVRMRAGQVSDTSGNAAAARVLGSFKVNIKPVTLAKRPEALGSVPMAALPARPPTGSSGANPSLAPSLWDDRHDYRTYLADFG